jgi:hypothetical protein
VKVVAVFPEQHEHVRACEQGEHEQKSSGNALNRRRNREA